MCLHDRRYFQLDWIVASVTIGSVWGAWVSVALNCHGVRWYFVNKNNVSNNYFVFAPFIQLYIDFNLKSTWFPIDHLMLFSHWLPLNGDDPSGPNYRPASRSSERGRNPGRLALPQKWEIRGLSHYQIGHFLVRSRKFSKHSEICVELSNRSRILQDSVLLPRYLTSCNVVWFKLPISRFQDFTGSYDKTSYWNGSLDIVAR